MLVLAGGAARLLEAVVEGGGRRARARATIYTVYTVYMPRARAALSLKLSVGRACAYTVKGPL
jgi:hypothetical protein